jgi:3-oxoacyl-[acyl-carrier protein] reductase
MTDLLGKAAFVTGGTRGIGAAIVRNLAGHGADVAFTYAASVDRAAALVGEIGALGRKAVAIEADSGDPQALRDAVSRAASELGRLDILVNNAGIFPSGPFEEVTLEEIDRTLAIHVRGAFVASQAALAHMGEGGRIISIGSCFAQRVPYAGVTLYAMSKSALVGLTKGLAREVGARGITVNVVDPGSTDTDMNPADGPGVAAELDLMALRHYAQPEDIAATVGHLAGPDGRFITGASIAVDGGFSA